jgi:hypothetical protein
MASTLSIAVIAASVSANVSTRNPKVIVKLLDQIMSNPTLKVTVEYIQYLMA